MCVCVCVFCWQTSQQVLNSQTLLPSLPFSTMLLLSDDVHNGSIIGGIEGTRSQGGSITNPFVTHSYRCVDAYETKDTKNRPFKVAVDEKLDVLIKDPSGETPKQDFYSLMMHVS